MTSGLHIPVHTDLHLENMNPPAHTDRPMEKKKRRMRREGGREGVGEEEERETEGMRLGLYREVSSSSQRPFNNTISKLPTW